MKNKFLAGIISAISVFALTACGGLGVSRDLSYSDYTEKVKGKVLTELVYDEEKIDDDRSLWYEFSKVDHVKGEVIEYEAKIHDGMRITKYVNNSKVSEDIFDIRKLTETEKDALYTGTTLETTITRENLGYAFVSNKYEYQADRNVYLHSEKDVLTLFEKGVDYKIVDSANTSAYAEFIRHFFNDSKELLTELDDINKLNGSGEELPIFISGSTSIISSGFGSVNYRTEKTIADAKKVLDVHLEYTACESFKDLMNIFNKTSLYMTKASVKNDRMVPVFDYTFDVKTRILDYLQETIKAPSLDNVVESIDPAQ